MSLQKKAGARPLFYLLLCMALGYVLYHSLAGGTLLTPNVYDSYSLQAANWLQGRSWILNGEHYTWLELAIYNGRYYVSFPPVPSVVLLPFVWLFGGAVPGNLLIALAGMLTAAGVYACFSRQGFGALECLFWAVFTCYGSNFCWLSTSGGVWFWAQVLNLCFVVWGLYFALGSGMCSRTLAAFLLACAVGCRPFSLIFLALVFGSWLWALPGKNPLRGGRGFWLPVVAAAAVGLALAGYNLARFGNPLEFGHNYLPEFTGAGNAQFGLGYLLPNLLGLLRPVTLNADLSLSFPLFNGFLLFAANPIFLLWAVQLAGKAWRRQFSGRDAALLGGFALALAALCLHKTMGGWQFGARYTVDLIPYVLADCWKGQRRPLTGGAFALCAAAVLFNLYGAVYMLSA